MSATYTNLLYHFVFSTKHRELLIRASFRERLYEYIGGIVRGEHGVLLEIGGMPDRVHVVAKIPASVAISEMMRLVKANSSAWLNDEQIAGGKFAWQAGYGAFTVSTSQLEAVRQYVRTQEEHHRGTSFQEELRALLRKHGIEFDERYMWD